MFIGIWMPSARLDLVKSTVFVTIISSVAKRADDNGEIAIRARTWIIKAAMRVQPVLPIHFLLNVISYKIDHQLLGVCSKVPYALAPAEGALASRANGSVRLTSSNMITVSWVYNTAMSVGRNRHANRTMEELSSLPKPECWRE